MISAPINKTILVTPKPSFRGFRPFGPPLTQYSIPRKVAIRQFWITTKFGGFDTGDLSKGLKLCILDKNRLTSLFFCAILCKRVPKRARLFFLRGGPLFKPDLDKYSIAYEGHDIQRHLLSFTPVYSPFLHIHHSRHPDLVPAIVRHLQIAEQGGVGDGPLPETASAILHGILEPLPPHEPRCVHEQV